MRGLENNHMGRGHQTDTRTCRLLDQLGPGGRVGENHVPNTFGLLSDPTPSNCYVGIKMLYDEKVLGCSQNRMKFKNYV